MSSNHRSAEEVRSSLAETKQRLARDLDALDSKLHHELTPRAIIARHPLLFGAVGAALLVLLISRPSLAKRSVTRVVEAGMPWLLQGLLKDF